MNQEIVDRIKAGRQRRLQQGASIAEMSGHEADHPDEIAFYPAHSPRKESPEYAKVHHEMVVTQNLPCLVCGVTHRTVQNDTSMRDPTLNPYAATAIETHHHVVEWVLAGAVDVEKFNKRVLPALQRNHPDRYPANRALSEADVRAWVDHSPDNLWVLCDVHHRHALLGVHSNAEPIWGPMDLLTDGFDAGYLDLGAESQRVAGRLTQTPERGA
jgi:hypothetical protein